MVCNDHTDSFTFFTAHWFYAILPNVPSDLPALLPPQKTFSWYQWGLFLHLYSRFFFVDVPSVRRSLMILFLVDLLRNLKEKSYYIPAIRSVPCSLLDILLHWSFMAKFLLCAFSFACIFLSCVIWSIWSFYFLQAIFYIHTTLLPPLHTKSQQIR